MMNGNDYDGVILVVDLVNDSILIYNNFADGFKTDWRMLVAHLRAACGLSEAMNLMNSAKSVLALAEKTIFIVSQRLQ